MKRFWQPAILLLIDAVFILSLVSTASAATSITGSYTGYLAFKSARAFGSTERCYSKSEIPTISFTMMNVKVKGKAVTGKYYNGQSYVTAKGSRVGSAFKLSFRYKLNGFTYVYNAVFSSVGTVKARVSVVGDTYSTKTSGCHYSYSGTVTHSS